MEKELLKQIVKKQQCKRMKNKYIMKSLKEISNDAFYKMESYHQITIDFVQETEVLFDEIPQNEEEKAQLITNLNCISYDIDNVLEVFNFEFKTEISDLKQILSLIEIRLGYVESLEFKYS